MRVDSRIVSIANGKLNIGPHHKYIVFYPETAGILCKKTNEPPKEGFVFQKEASTTLVPIPARLRIAYGLDLQIQLEKLDEETMYIHQKLKVKKIPEPLPLYSISKSGGRIRKKETGWRSCSKEKSLLVFFQYLSKRMENEKDFCLCRRLSSDRSFRCNGPRKAERNSHQKRLSI